MKMVRVDFNTVVFEILLGISGVIQLVKSNMWHWSVLILGEFYVTGYENDFNVAIEKAKDAGRLFVNA